MGNENKTKDEPILAGLGIHKTWQSAWEKTVARVWYERETNKNGEKSEWYMNLFSNDPDKVLRSLIEEGLVINMDGNTEESLKNQKWLNLKILIKEREDGVSLVKNKQNGSYETVPVIYTENNCGPGYVYDTDSIIPKNGWSEVKRMEHTLVMTIPPKPDYPAVFAAAIADLEAAGDVYPFTMT